MGRSAKWLGFAVGVALLMTTRPVNSTGQEVKQAAPRVAVPAVAAVPAMLARPRIDDAMLKQWEQSYGPMIKQAFRMELHFMRLVTDPTKPQFEKIAADCEPSTKAALRIFVESMTGAGNAGDQYDVRSPITEAIAKSIAANLSPEQATRYRKEIELRTAARKRLVVINLVAMTDKVAMLRPDQREKLTEILADNWNESWNQTQLLVMGGQYFPVMPEAKINPILTDSQRTVFRGIQKQTVRFSVHFGGVPGVEAEDEVWDDNPPRKVPEPAKDKVDPIVPKLPKPDPKP